MSANTIISVEHLTKKYNLNKSAQTENDLLIKSLFHSFKKITQKKSTEEFLALNDISFTIQQGDRVGIIGRNGAGKSTLLKILSRITPPSSGRVQIDGRVTSLLEVGTGFHGDLSGRENIYLNGSILGMSKQEINKKFDEIVAFAEVEKFLDTPVKRYSSGMYVRLAFSVAAHLESDILIVDEVLAVGDAAFQNKCLGKMEEANHNSGKTILFVSHNMGQVSALCNKGILLNKGQVEMNGPLPEIITHYFNNGASENVTCFKYESKPESEYCIRQVRLLNHQLQECKNFAHDETISIEIEVEQHVKLNDVLLGIRFCDMYDKRIFTSNIALTDKFEKNGTSKFKITIPHTTLTPNTYNFSIGIHIPNIQLIDEKNNVGTFQIYDNGSEFYKYSDVDNGVVFVNCKWEMTN
ncbi:MAG: ABC transporter ATP-binding protein [Sediminibacterium sp.]|nr:ABC transporter ATP-binding protein [Sediminibacterium sp.]